MLDANSATAALRKIQQPAINGVFRDEATRVQENVEYAKVDAQFREYLETYYAEHLSAASRDIVWNAAYKNGMHKGYREVEICYEDYAELDDEILATVKW